MDVAATKVHIFVNVFVRVLRVNDICQVSTTIHLITIDVVCIIICTLVIFLNDRLSETEFICESDLAQLHENFADAFSMATLEFVRRHIKLNTKLFQLKDYVLTGSHRVVVFVPSLHLMVVH